MRGDRLSRNTKFQWRQPSRLHKHLCIRRKKGGQPEADSDLQEARIDEGNASKESPSVALVIPLDTSIEGQANMQLEKEQVSESREVGEEGEPLLPLITSNRQSRRLEQKRGSSEYRCGQVVSNAAKRKAILVDPDPGTFLNPINVLNLLSDESLLSIAHTHT